MSISSWEELPWDSAGRGVTFCSLKSICLSLCCGKHKPSAASFLLSSVKQINIFQMIWVAKDKLQQAGWEFLVCPPLLLLIHLCSTFSTGGQPMMDDNDSTVCPCPENWEDISLGSWSCHRLQWLWDLLLLFSPGEQVGTVVVHKKPCQAKNQYQISSYIVGNSLFFISNNVNSLLANNFTGFFSMAGSIQGKSPIWVFSVPFVTA